MKKIVILVILLGAGISFLIFKNEKVPETAIEEKIIPPTKEKGPKKPEPKFLKEEEGPIQRPYLDADFKPMDSPPTGSINIENKINPDLDKLIQKQFQNTEIPTLTADVKLQGAFILVKAGVGRFVEQILVTINNPGEGPRTFNAYADAETGEIIHTIEPLPATYSSTDMESSEVEQPASERAPEDSFEQPPEEDMSIPFEE